MDTKQNSNNQNEIPKSQANANNSSLAGQVSPSSTSTGQMQIGTGAVQNKTPNFSHGVNVQANNTQTQNGASGQPRVMPNVAINTPNSNVANNGANFQQVPKSTTPFSQNVVTSNLSNNQGVVTNNTLSSVPTQNPNGIQPGQMQNSNQTLNLNNNKNLSSDEKAVVNNKKKRKRKTALLLSLLLSFTAIASVLIALFVINNKRFDVNFETGPFAEIKSTSAKINSVFDTPPDIDDLYNKDGELLAKFTGWYIKDDMAMKLNMNLQK